MTATVREIVMETRVIVENGEMENVMECLLTFQDFELVSARRVSFSATEPMQVHESVDTNDITEIIDFVDFDTQDLHNEFITQFLSIGDTCSVESEVLV